MSTRPPSDIEAILWLGNRGIAVPGEHYRRALWLKDATGRPWVAAECVPDFAHKEREFDLFPVVGESAEPWDGAIVPRGERARLYLAGAVEIAAQAFDASCAKDAVPAEPLARFVCCVCGLKTSKPNRDATFVQSLRCEDFCCGGPVRPLAPYESPKG